MPYDFKHIVDFIFKDKENYERLSDEDKEKNFFIINKKFARGLPQYAKLFNNKAINKPTALDLWFHFFIKKRITSPPRWYWGKKKSKSKPSILTIKEKKFFMSYYDLKERDIDFLEKHNPEELKLEKKKLVKLMKNK